MTGIDDGSHREPAFEKPNNTMTYSSEAILLTRLEIQDKSRALSESLMHIPLYDSQKRIDCIEDNIKNIQNIIADRIINCGGNNCCIVSGVMCDLLMYESGREI